MWTMGLLRDEDWHATWIGAKTTDLPDPTVLGYATEAQQADEVMWVQVDLGAAKRIERVVLHPMRHEDPAAGGWINGYAFPLRFRLDISDGADFQSSTTITDRTKADYTNPALTPVTCDAGGKTARYVRLTATRLWHRGPNLPYCLTLAEMQVFSGEENVALHAQVSAKDSVEAFGWAKSHLTDGLRNARRPATRPSLRSIPTPPSCCARKQRSASPSNGPLTATIRGGAAWWC